MTEEKKPTIINNSNQPHLHRIKKSTGEAVTNALAATRDAFTKSANTEEFQTIAEEAVIKAISNLQKEYKSKDILLSDDFCTAVTQQSVDAAISSLKEIQAGNTDQQQSSDTHAAMTLAARNAAENYARKQRKAHNAALRAQPS